MKNKFNNTFSFSAFGDIAKDRGLFAFLGRLLFSFHLIALLYFLGLAASLPKELSASPQGFFLDYREFQKASLRSKAPLVLPKEQILRYWRGMEYVPEDFSYPQPLRPRDKGKNHFLFLQADNASKQIRKLKEKYKEDFALLALQMESPKEALWWKRIDERSALHRRLQRKERRLALRISSLAQRGISALDKIDDIDIEESLPVRLLRAHLYRNRISNLIALQEYELALSVLEDLKRMNPVKEDWVMHYYFAYALNRRLHVWRKDTARSDAELRRLRKQKNFHLLLSVELRFGKNSPEFREIKKIVEHEELGSPRSSEGPQFRL